jgi:beta-lactamase regulating signal transducer with metallopeptidase domain
VDTLLRAGLSNALAATLMALVVTGLSRPLARRPAILHGLWLLVLLKLLTPPFYELPIPWPVSPTASAPTCLEVQLVEVDAVVNDDPADLAAAPGRVLAPSNVGTDPWGQANLGPAAFHARHFDPSRWVVATWLAGALVVLLLSFRRIRRFQRLLHEATGASWHEQDWVDEWAVRMGLRRAPDLWWVPGRISPMIWWVGGRPRLIVPQELWKTLDSHQRSTLIAHELAHLKRGDHYVRLLELLATALFWWHPLVWWLRGPLRDVEEQCCDAWVVWALPDATRSYAETLLDTLEFLQQSGRPDPLLASGLGKVPHLRRRLTMIMTGTSRRLPGLPGKLGLLLVAGALLPVGASWAQQAKEKKDVRVVVTSDDDKVILENIKGEVLELDEPVEVDVRVDPTVAVEAPAPKAFAYRFESQDGSPQAVELSLDGSVDQVIKKLEEKIAEGKLGAEETKVLKQALEALKKHGPTTKTMRVRRVVPGNPAVAQTVRLRRVEPAKKDDPAAKSPEGQKAQAEIAKLKADLNATLDQLRHAQAKLRELGEDPGDAPFLTWRRDAKGAQVQAKAFTFVRPVEAGVRTTTVRPVRRETVPLSDQQRMEQLEQKLKALQQEFDGLKKGSTSGPPKE